jgi:hypothetical protein
MLVIGEALSSSTGAPNNGMQRTRNQYVSLCKACRWRRFVRAADAQR